MRVYKNASRRYIKTPSLMRVRSEARRFSWRRLLLVAVVAALVAWGLFPAIRAVTQIANWSHRGEPSVATAGGLSVRDVRFTATDGVRLAGWLALHSPEAPTVILVHGSKGSRVDMLPWARYLIAAGYNALLYDSRGCGASDGWHIGDGATEADDVVGAVRYLKGLAELHNKRFAALGVSLGAGTVLLAGAREPALLAVVADSSWANQDVLIARLKTLTLGRFSLPLLPYGLPVLNALIGSDLSKARPLAVVGSIAPRAVLFIHSADDANATTPLAGEQALFAAAGNPKDEWIAPSGGHVGALATHPADYEAKTLAFLQSSLGPGVS